MLQHPLAADPGAVDEGAVDAGIEQHHAITGGMQLGVATGHLGAGHHDVGARLPTKDQGAIVEAVFAAIGEAHNASAARAHFPTIDVEGGHETGSPGPGVILDQDLVAADTDLVAVEQRGRLGTEANAVDLNLGIAQRPDGGGTIGPALNHGVLGRNPGSEEGDGGLGVGADQHIARYHAMAAPFDVELDHASAW